MIQFLLNDRVTCIESAASDLTVLDYLRDQQGLCGSKEGCASGDCGACTVSLAQISKSGEAISYRSINSCVTFLSALQGKQLITVEHIAEQDTLHPVQQAMVDNHASQCGFCTPGFVMSLFTFYHQETPVNHQTVELALSGNLCRCTGYRPIIDAALQSCSVKHDDKFDLREKDTITALKKLQTKPTEQTGIAGLYIPTTSTQLAQLIAEYPQAKIFAGSTDLALEVTQQLKSLDCLIDLKMVAELNQITVTDDYVDIGAALPFNVIEPALLSHFPTLKEVLWRFASLPIRNQASLGGNVANASPIGDMPPVLLALNAFIVCDDGESQRRIPARTFFKGYRQTALRANEWIRSIQLPLLKNNQLLRAYKVSKRFEDDISAVCAVFSIELSDNLVVNLTTGFGGVAATPAYAAQLEKALAGLDWGQSSTMQMGTEILKSTFEPIDDVRASAHYRQQLIVNLWRRFWLQTNRERSQIETRVIEYA